MIKIVLNGDRKNVTKGAYENYYKSLGYKIENGSEKVEHNENVIPPKEDNSLVSKEDNNDEVNKEKESYKRK